MIFKSNRVYTQNLVVSTEEIFHTQNMFIVFQWCSEAKEFLTQKILYSKLSSFNSEIFCTQNWVVGSYKYYLFIFFSIQILGGGMGNKVSEYKASMNIT